MAKKKKTRLKMMIEARNLDQNELSTMTGIMTYQISNLASGKNTSCHIDTIKRICEALDCSFDDAFGDIM